MCMIPLNKIQCNQIPSESTFQQMSDPEHKTRASVELCGSRQVHVFLMNGPDLNNFSALAKPDDWRSKWLTKLWKAGESRWTRARAHSGSTRN